MPLAGTQKSDEELATELLDMLDRWDARLNGHQNQKREHSRVAFRSRIVVELPELADFDQIPDEESRLQVWARNLSPSGVSFLHRSMIESRKIVVCLGSEGGVQLKYLARIVRSRKLQDGFQEYGAVFLERLEN
jgi:hypothetical protein